MTSVDTSALVALFSGTSRVDAAALYPQPATGLRSADSLHLAIASRLACKSVVSFDETLNRNARTGGLAAIAP